MKIHAECSAVRDKLPRRPPATPGILEWNLSHVASESLEDPTAKISTQHREASDSDAVVLPGEPFDRGMKARRGSCFTEVELAGKSGRNTSGDLALMSAPPGNSPPAWTVGIRTPYPDGQSIRIFAAKSRTPCRRVWSGGPTPKGRTKKIPHEGRRGIDSCQPPGTLRLACPPKSSTAPLRETSRRRGGARPDHARVSAARARMPVPST